MTAAVLIVRLCIVTAGLDWKIGAECMEDEENSDLYVVENLSAGQESLTETPCGE